MWRSQPGRDRTTVDCIACGTAVLHSEAREYDKEGDRWDRADKEFEHLCRGCHRELCHQPRTDLESMLLEAEAGEVDREEFLARYVGAVKDRSSDGDH